MADDELAELKARVAELEKLLKSRSQPAEITADEMAAYKKVSDALAFDVGDCGINECYRMPVLKCVQRCIVVKCIVKCTYECSCGPCNVGGYMGGGFSRFEEFGG
jgi:hypothetical protein